MALSCLLRREYAPAQLLAAHPPILRHAHKRLVFELACPRGTLHAGTITLTRWSPTQLPQRVELAATELVPMADSASAGRC